MRKVLFMMYDMHCGGVEKALLELLKVLCKKTDWQIKLLLLDCRGEFMEQLPDRVIVERCALPLDVYLETTSSTKEALKHCIQEKKIGTAYRIMWDWLRNRGKDQQQILRHNYARWERRLNRVKQRYDIAIDFQGAGAFTTFYISKMISAEKKASWIHNDISIFPEDMSWQTDLYRSFDKVFCVSNQVKEKTEQKNPFLADKLDVLYNILPREEILQKAALEEKPLAGEIKILTIGRLSYEKGYDIALQAMKLLCQTDYDFRYYIVGDGEDRQFLSDLSQKLGLQEQVVFLGQQMNPYVYLKHCDIYLQPSRWEGFCLTLGEAKIFRKPIITTDFAGAREQIEHGSTGLVISCDSREMADALRQLIENPSMQDTLRRNLTDADNVPVEHWQKLLQL